MGRSSSPLSDSDFRALARFRHALRVFLSFSEREARAAGLSPAQHQLLLAVRGHAGDEDPVIGDLADALLLRHHSVVELIDRAVDAGLVDRVTDPVDQRRQRIVLTAEGDAVLAELSRVHRDELRRFRTEMVDVLSELE
jgi:DNA-binding MarR family transcriptional regulator